MEMSRLLQVARQDKIGGTIYRTEAVFLGKVLEYSLVC